MAKILIVDDEKGIRVTLSEFLRDEGHDVVTADEAIKAIHLLDEQGFDVVVTDIIMPYIDGVDLLQSIHSSYPDVRVILITGEPFLDSGPNTKPAGSFAYLAKPFTREEFCNTVAEALEDIAKQSG